MGRAFRSHGMAVLGILLLKLLVAVPHLIILWFLTVASYLAGWIGFWIVLFTGTFPEGLHKFIVGVHRWTVRTGAWITGLADDYPPFSLS